MSKRQLRGAQYSVHKLFAQDTKLAYKTRHQYETIAKQCVKQLFTARMPIPHIERIKTKHVKALLKHWQTQALSSDTIKNRLAVIRHIGKHYSIPRLLPENNAQIVNNSKPDIKVNRAHHTIDLSKISDPYVRCAMELQQHFGLRCEESIKFKVHQADHGQFIRLQASWTKGGIERVIPVTQTSQRELLDRLKQSIPRGSALIPDDKLYKSQENRHKYEIKKTGLQNLHGLRHAYAQRRYYELTSQWSKGHGWHAPNNGGKSRYALTKEEAQIDQQARLCIANELGHSRLSITVVYLG